MGLVVALVSLRGVFVDLGSGMSDRGLAGRLVFGGVGLAAWLDLLVALHSTVWQV